MALTEIVLETVFMTRSYGSLKAVDNLSLEVHRGEVFGFLGPNGAGKTTSIMMMCGLLKPDSGQVLIHGKPVRNSFDNVRSRVGICPQETILWDNLTCADQLELMGEMYGMKRSTARQRGAELLEVLGLSNKYGELAGRLSGGMKRRLNLALGLIHDPDIVVLDEPEAGLDPQSRLLVREYIRSLARVKTVILTTHNMDEAERLADRVAIIDHGRLLVVDTPSALKDRLGDGDVLELEIRGNISNAADIVQKTVQDVIISDPQLLVRGHDMVGRLPEILNNLRKAEILHNNLKLRTNTLEDVFIDLTGRGLRE
jgi:ABC-2 type transport system ATP-binding protein